VLGVGSSGLEVEGGGETRDDEPRKNNNNRQTVLLRAFSQAESTRHWVSTPKERTVCVCWCALGGRAAHARALVAAA